MGSPHGHTRSGLEEGFHLALRHTARADHQGFSGTEIQKYRIISHTVT